MWTASLLLLISSLVYVNGFGLGPTLTPGAEWEEEWRRVSDIVDEAPPARLFVEWPDNVRVLPNVTIPVGQMLERPRVVWPTEPGALYTLILFDGWSDRVVEKPYNFWIVTNIPGNSVKEGNEVMQYLEPMAIAPKEDGTFEKDPEKSNHPMLFLVFKQARGEKIYMEEGQRGCLPDIVSGRVHYWKDLSAKYALGLPIAGNFFQNPYSGYYTYQVLCRFTKCQGQGPFPYLIPGGNDMPECQPRKIIQDITVVAPKLDRRKEYAYCRSLYSLGSIPTQIKDLYPVFSTGKVKDFSSIQGSFGGVPYGTNNQADVAQGVFDATFFSYPKDKTRELFERAAELIPAIPKCLNPATTPFDGGKGYKVILSEPDDQDWEYVDALDRPGMVMEMFIVRVKDGQEEEFQRLRKQFIALTRSSNNVENVFTFTVARGIMQPQDPLFFDSTNNELMITVHPSRAAQRKAVAELGTADPDLLQSFAATFECIMCSVLEDNIHPSFLPPQPNYLDTL